MKTIVLKVEKGKTRDSIRRAASIIRKGGLVAFPTETVYGLGANALDARAVGKIFKAKGRPADNPLIVHVSSMKMAKLVSEEISPKAQKLIEVFWPGPLTLLVKKSDEVPAEVTAGLPTVAIRKPSHPVALALIKKAGVPIAAPSANISGRPSPTDAAHVIEDFWGKIDAVLDGGSTEIGIESTVLDVTKNPPLLLRPGAVTIKQLVDVVGNVRVHASAKGKPSRTALAPGMKYRHYAPKARVLIARNKNDVLNLLSKTKAKNKKAAVIARFSGKADLWVRYDNAIDLGRLLFRAFRECDAQNMDAIIVQAVPERGIGLAVMNRIKKAAASPY